jgi:drug/metabolite transporter (DMT)-like permease
MAQSGWFYGIALIPLAQVFAIEFTTPIWTALIAMLFLGERVTRWRLLAITLGFVGILVILRPGAAVISFPALAVLGAAIGYSISYASTKSLGRTDSPLTIIFFMTVIQLPLAFFPALTDWSIPSSANWPWIVIVGVTALSAHYCIARALALADAMVVVPMDFMRLPLIAVVGILLYAEPLDPWVLVGGLIIFTGVFVNIRQSAKVERAAGQE